jgi:hypothetical protein
LPQILTSPKTSFYIPILLSFLFILITTSPKLDYLPLIPKAQR